LACVDEFTVLLLFYSLFSAEIFEQQHLSDAIYRLDGDWWQCRDFCRLLCRCQCEDVEQ